MPIESQEKFSEWCVLELLGHVRLAGLVSEITLAGHGMLRIDVPELEIELEKIAGFSQVIGPGSIYRLSIISKETAIAYARNLRATPLAQWDFRTATRPLQRTLLASDDPPHDDLENEDD